MRSKNLPLLILPLILAGTLFYFYGHFTWNPPPSSSKQSMRSEIVKSSHDQQLEKFSLSGFDDAGKSNWKLEGDTAKVDPGQTVYLDQNVTLKLQDNTLVRTDHVQWSQDGGELRTASIVTVEHENATVRGRGAYGRPNDGFVQLNHDIEMLINLSTKVTCAGPMKVYYHQNFMTFFRKVKVVDSRGTLTSNRMDVRFDPVTKRIKELVAIGNVVIVRGEDTTRSQRAIYSVETGSVRLEGSPEVTLHKGSGGIIDGALRNQSP